MTENGTELLARNLNYLPNLIRLELCIIFSIWYRLQ